MRMAKFTSQSQMLPEIMRSTSKLKEIMERRAAIVVPGAANAMFAGPLKILVLRLSM